jgi:[citrate (pro-3S)-lyase] ligase
MSESISYDLSNYLFKYIKESFNHCNEIGADFYLLFYPSIDSIAAPSQIESFLKKHILPDDEKTKWLKSCPDHFKHVYSNQDKEYLNNILSLPSPVKNSRGLLVHPDHTSKYVNFTDGKRFTTDAPTDYNKTIHVFGPSYIAGFGSSDSETIPSQLQNILNKTEKCRVINYGTVRALWDDSYAKLLDSNIQKGDIVVMFNAGLLYNDIMINFNEKVNNYCLSHKIPMYNLSNVIQRPHNNGDIFVDRSHLGPKGNAMIAEKISNILYGYKLEYEAVKNITEDIFKDKFSPPKAEYDEEISQFLSGLEKYKVSGNDIASIVMNCNPFTLGHRYLIEKAASEVDHLYIFIVQEDRSFFRFKDRIELVKQGTRDLENVTVLAGGEFIISSITFPEYFDKDVKKDVAINATGDLSIFANKIAPYFNIRTRYVGEEPFCQVTRQYNEQMKEKLSADGIKVIEIPRHEIEGIAVSASRVRKLLAEGDMESLSKIVPETTLKFLQTLV